MLTLLRVVVFCDDEYYKKDTEMPDYVKKVVYVPYICTVPGGGVKAIECHPDAVTIIVNGKKVGYSPKERALLRTLDVTGAEIRAVRSFLLHVGVNGYQCE